MGINKKIALTPKQQKRRQEFLTKQVHHREEMHRYAKLVDKLDEKQAMEKRKWMLGKCFAMKSETDKRAGDSGYCRVDGFSEHGRRIAGIKIYTYKNKITTIEFDSTGLWESYILRGKKISHARFDKLLEQARILTYTPQEDTIIDKLKIKKPLHTNFVDKIRKIIPTVTHLLKADADARDDDNLMCALVWQFQGAKPNMKFKEFRKKLIMGELATPESITRSRRKRQEKYPELRGKFYEERHDQEELLKTQFKIDFDL